MWPRTHIKDAALHLPAVPRSSSVLEPTPESHQQAPPEPHQPGQEHSHQAFRKGASTHTPRLITDKNGLDAYALVNGNVAVGRFETFLDSGTTPIRRQRDGLYGESTQGEYYSKYHCHSLPQVVFNSGGHLCIFNLGETAGPGKCAIVDLGLGHSFMTNADITFVPRVATVFPPIPMSPRTTPSAVLALVILALRLSPPAAAQGTFGAGPGTNATCGPAYDWMDNHLSPPQSPCYVASFLLSECSSPASSWVYPLGDGQIYTIPTADDTDIQCVCNSVWYNIIEACATCQGQSVNVPPWLMYTAACKTANAGPTIGSIPRGFPILTGIPSWAFLDPTLTGTFDASAASSVALSNPTDSTQVRSSTASSATSTSSTRTTASADPGSPSNGSDNASSSSGAKSDVGPIVGGVVGGLAALALVGGATYLLLRRRRARETYPGPSHGQFDVAPPPPPPMSMYGGSAGTGYAAEPGAQPYGSPVPAERERSPDALVPPRLYDPNDPSTFPNAQAYHADSARSPTTQGSARGSAQGAQLGYKGIPEM
ncbi:uncharacterized protein BXZ73DRAFT_102619 [Epithele typhae]|uniref:uncharacterized protein n=1 Tax=Epithele typhae TaxID=378194 RepID=UPI0020084802|nr:uncharacterized protein BXZ73DRAFT_102619 [Epithele typhae]KAH9927487.1 hypothetical protein BXZ73DRAFT_102619 [Epithele typhae]